MALPDQGVCATTLSGVVYDPVGKIPLYNAVVFIPEGSLGPIAQGTHDCNTCSVSVGQFLAATPTDEKGAFVLTNVPAGPSVPLVVQVGKWRRETFVPNVTQCQTTQVPAELTRLPRSRLEGDMPQMALLTGACDQLACFLGRVGIDPQEFTGPSGRGRVHVYRGAGPGPDLLGGGDGPAGDCTGAAGPCPLWSTKAALEAYDLVALGCECGENKQTKPDMTPMHDWLSEGGRLIAIHDQETWLKNGPADFQGVADWAATDAGAPGPCHPDTTYHEGQSYAKWLAAVGALDSTGAVSLDPEDVSRTVSGVNPETTRRWVFAGNTGDADGGADGGDADGAGGPVETLSVDVPVPSTDGGYVTPPCGRAVVTDVHVGANGTTSTAAIPASCTGGEMSPEEKALEFLFFDFSVCVGGELPPVPPPPNK